MTITNRHGLPQTIVRALEKAEATYNAGESDATVSSLHEPPRAVLLKSAHRDEISADVSERVNSLLGTAFHHVAELAAGVDDIVEKRYFAEVLGWNISGQVDNYDPLMAHLRDWKVLSVWGVVVGDAIQEYTKKLNTYAYILRANGLKVEKLSIVVLFRDWQAREARANPDYPQQQIIEYALDVWPDAKAEAYTTDLTAKHQNARIGFDRDGALPECNDDERWAKPTRYAVMKQDAKRATKVCDTYDEAQSVAAPIKGARVETRPGEYTKCQFFCAARTVCSVGKSLEAAAEASF